VKNMGDKVDTETTGEKKNLGLQNIKEQSPFRQRGNSKKERARGGKRGEGDAGNRKARRTPGVRERRGQETGTKVIRKSNIWRRDDLVSVMDTRFNSRTRG